MSANVKFRHEQERIIYGYRGGKMGIAAVPGSGKTFTLSHLAARLVEELTTQGVTSGVDRQEVLIVTFTNTAVNSFRSRIADILQRERGLLPYIGYRVRTLHGLAHDIVRERPSLTGLSEDFQIIDERIATQIIRDVSKSLLPQFMDDFLAYLDPEVLGTEKQLRKVQNSQVPGIASDLALTFIKHAKNNLMHPADVRYLLDKSKSDLSLIRFGLAVYEDYQRSLSYRGAVDFDDLVRLAIVTLEGDKAYCHRLQQRWPYILEDEAQDSSRLQEHMLQLLSNNQNWVRVGDPNQAINTTFTTADPQFLRDFLDRQDVQPEDLYTSGRSALPIIELANTLMHWATEEHPVPELRNAFRPQEIRPTEPGDPQPNPPTDTQHLHIHYRPNENVSPEAELELVARNVEQFLDLGKNYTVAVLTPENSRGYKLAEMLQARGVPFEELLRSTSATREAAGRLNIVMAYLANPVDSRFLTKVYVDVWCKLPSSRIDSQELQTIAARVISGCRQIERFLWPVTGSDWLEEVDVVAKRPEIDADLRAFRAQVQTWLEAASLPVDQLVLTLTHDLFFEPSDIALGYKISVVMRSLAQSSPAWRLPDFVAELHAISENQRKFIGFDDVEQGYEPTPGQVTVATMHAAKGLEWDRVYLMGVSNYGFPSAQQYDNYIAEKWFLRDNINLEAEILAQLHALMSGVPYVEGVASLQARIDYAAERLRLLYVGITRARRNLMITWNTGRFWQKGGNFVNRPALPLVVLWHSLQGEI